VVIASTITLLNNSYRKLKLSRTSHLKSWLFNNQNELWQHEKKDEPARALVRCAAELSSILQAIIYDRDMFRRYIAPDNKSAKQTWYELFSGKRISNKLAEIERTFGVPGGTGGAWWT
jgi:hypothetical protein